MNLIICRVNQHTSPVAQAIFNHFLERVLPSSAHHVFTITHLEGHLKLFVQHKTGEGPTLEVKESVLLFDGHSVIKYVSSGIFLKAGTEGVVRRLTPNIRIDISEPNANLDPIIECAKVDLANHLDCNFEVAARRLMRGKLLVYHTPGDNYWLLPHQGIWMIPQNAILVRDDLFKHCC